MILEPSIWWEVSYTFLSYSHLHRLVASTQSQTLSPNCHGQQGRYELQGLYEQGFFRQDDSNFKVEKGKSNLAAHNNSLLNQGRAVISDTNTLYKPNFLYRILPKSLCTQIKEHQSPQTSAVFEYCRATAVASSTHTKFKFYLTKITPSRKPEQRKPSVNRDEGLDLPAI